MKKTIIFIIPLFVFGCIYDPPEKKIKVYNNTDNTVYVYCTCSDSILKTDSLNRFNVYESPNPSIVFGRIKYKRIGSPRYRLNPYSWGSLYQTGQKSLLESCLDKKIRIFYISDTIMQSKTWKEIVSNQLYIKKEVFGVKDLESYDWTIEYNN